MPVCLPVFMPVCLPACNNQKLPDQQSCPSINITVAELQLPTIIFEKVANLKLRITKKYDCGIAELQLRTKISLKSCGIAYAEVLPTSCGVAIADCVCPPLYKSKCLLHRYWPANHQLIASYQDGRRLSLQLESHYASQQLQKADSCYGQLPRGGGSRQLGSSCQFSLDRSMWQAGVLNKCKLAEECRAASEKVKKKLHPTFKSYFASLLFTFVVGKGTKI
jgi:hypothetical protein